MDKYTDCFDCECYYHDSDRRIDVCCYPKHRKDADLEYALNSDEISEIMECPKKSEEKMSVVTCPYCYNSMECSDKFIRSHDIEHGADILFTCPHCKKEFYLKVQKSHLFDYTGYSYRKDDGGDQ